MQDFLTEEFWTEIVEAAATWLITELPGLLIIIVLFFIALKVIRVFINRLKKTLITRAEKSESTDTDEAVKRINTIVAISYRLFIVVLFVVFFMLVLQKVGINVGPLLASVGILGLAIGFGAQELVKDFISGFFIILENQIRTGDVAILNGQGGIVESIDLRTITLRDFSGTLHTFQNGKINTMANMTKDWSAIVFNIGVAYKEDVVSVMNIMQQVGDELREDETCGPDIIEPMEIFGVDDFADSAVVIKARIKTKPIKQWAIGREYRKRLKYAFDEKGIEIPFPHTTVYWGEEINPLKLDVNQKQDKMNN